MTPQEAIKYIDQHAHIADDVKDMCIEALEKKIPKKIDLNRSTNLLKNDYYACPICNKFFGYQYDKPIEEYRTEYCPDCGQALKWE